MSRRDGVATAAQMTVEGVVCPCNTISDFPRVCGIHGLTTFVPWDKERDLRDSWRDVISPGRVELVRSLSDDDVKRIARAVVEQMRGGDRDPGDEDRA